MRKYAFLLVTLWYVCGGPAGPLSAQDLDTDLEVYEFSDGLSHRNVFKIIQDTTGMIWVATINGLNSFDGYQFRAYHTDSPTGKLPADMVADVVLNPAAEFVLAGPDFLTTFVPETRRSTPRQIKSGELVRRESLAPRNLCYVGDQLWCTVFDEVDGRSRLARWRGDRLEWIRDLPGANVKRPLAAWHDRLVLPGRDNQLETLASDGTVLRTTPIGESDEEPSPVAALQVAAGQLWMLLEDGRLYRQAHPDSTARFWNVVPYTTTEAGLETLLVEPDGDVWVGGFGTLWYYDHWQQGWRDYDQFIRREIRNTCTYRQVYQDDSEAIWLATDFGAMKITQSDRLFDHYLSGGSEYCSNVYCSTRGMTEDDDGNIYFSYYNAIHVLDPATQILRPLFPRRDYFNYPFGLAYAAGAIYTGNGIRIDLQTLSRDTLFAGEREDKGAVLIDDTGQVWMGYEQRLYRYDPVSGAVDSLSLGDTTAFSGTISYLLQEAENDLLWIATLDNGLYAWDMVSGEIKVHYHAGGDSPAPLPHEQINAIWSPQPEELWLATARGLVKLLTADDQLRVYTTEDGLPNDFINGMISEGDSCLWISTDNGLSRLSMFTDETLNFTTDDGLTSNEFNRNSFYRARSGRFYFGGLNGVNAFLPDERYRQRKTTRAARALVLTSFSYLDGVGDSLRVFPREQQTGIETFELSHRDRMFTAEFALLDYRNPDDNTFQYYLEGYDDSWSEPTNLPQVSFSDLKPGRYVLHVRGRGDREDWSTQELSIPIRIRPAIYQRLWFWPLTILLIIGLVAGLMQYRVRILEKRRRELQDEVRRRTRELAKEKQKSEELLLNILPAELAEELKQNGFAKAKRHERVTVMFSDFQGFTAISEQLEPEELVAEIDLCFRAFDEITERHGLEKIKTIGDAYLLVGGINQEAEHQARQVVMAALEIQEFMKAIAVERRLHGRHFFEARIGIHTGPLVAGIVGIKKFAYDIWGDTVNIASRMETNGQVGEVNLSESTYRLVHENFRCKPYGSYSEHTKTLNMYLVEEYTG